MNLRDRYGETALFKAVLSYSPAAPGYPPGSGLGALQALLQAGVEVDVRNLAGATAVDLAAQKGHAAVVALLSRAQAGRTPGCCGDLIKFAEVATRIAALSSRRARPPEVMDKQVRFHSSMPTHFY